MSDYVANERTLGNMGDMTVVYNYGFLGCYGVGFGFPLLLGLPSDTKSCGREDFLAALEEYQLKKGISGLIYKGASATDARSILTEFERIISTKLSCIDNSENIESRVASNAISNLIAAMNARLDLEADQADGNRFRSRHLDLDSQIKQQLLTQLPASVSL